MTIIENNDKNIIYELDKKDKTVDWFLNVYQESDIYGKLVFMDEKMLLRILNSRKCFVEQLEAIPCENSMDQTIKIRWCTQDSPIMKAEICVHGPNQVYIDSSDGFMNYNIKADDRNWIYFKDVKFVSEYEGSYEDRILGEFEYGRKRNEDDKFVFLVYNYQEKARLKEQQEEIMQLNSIEFWEWINISSV